MNPWKRLVLNIVLNATIPPTMMMIATGKPSAFLIALVVFWPALLASAGLHSETIGQKRPQLMAVVGSIALLPFLVFLTLVLNPSLALLLQDGTNWIVGAATGSALIRGREELNDLAQRIFAKPVVRA